MYETANLCAHLAADLLQPQASFITIEGQGHKKIVNHSQRCTACASARVIESYNSGASAFDAIKPVSFRLCRHDRTQFDEVQNCATCKDAFRAALQAERTRLFSIRDRRAAGRMLGLIERFYRMRGKGIKADPRTRAALDS
jgi:hypothetical protein